MRQIVPHSNSNFIIDERQIFLIFLGVIFFELLHSEPYFGARSMIQIIIGQIRYDTLLRGILQCNLFPPYDSVFTHGFMPDFAVDFVVIKKMRLCDVG
jgi:hypothetical protein